MPAERESAPEVSHNSLFAVQIKRYIFLYDVVVCMTGAWLIKKNGQPVVEPKDENNFNSFVEGMEVPQQIYDVMGSCKHGDTITIECELPE